MQKWFYVWFLISSFALNAQVPLLTLDYRSLEDSVKIARVYKPQKIHQGDSESLDYDFSQTKYGCTQALHIETKDDELFMSAEYFSTHQKEIKGKTHFIHEWTFDYIFGINKPIQCTFIQPLSYLNFPAKEGQGYDAKVEASIFLQRDEASGLFLDIMEEFKLDSAEFYLATDVNIEVDIQQKVLFHYGERLAYPVISNFVFSLVKVKNASNNQLIDVSMYNKQNTKGEQITYVNIFNSYKGIWLASICKYRQEVAHVDLISQANIPFSKRPCKELDKTIQVYPNPTFGQMKLYSNLDQSGVYFFELYSIIGQRIWRTEIQLEKGIEVNEIVIPNPRKGTYLYSVRNPAGDRLFTRRLNILEF